MKRLLTAVTLLCCALALSSAPSRVTLWFHGGTDAETASTKALIDRFNASQNQYEDVITKLREDYFTGSTFSYLAAAYSAMLTGQSPDILDLDGPNVASYAWRGFLSPLEQVLPESLKSDVLPSILEQGSYNGHLYAYGQYDSGLALAGRKSLLKKAGIRIPKGVSDAWTIDEFKQALVALKAIGAAPYSIDLKMNYGANEWYSYAFSPIVQGFGGDLIDRSTYRQSEGMINGPSSVAAMKFLKGLFDAKLARVDSTDEDFINGTAAMGFCGHWVALDYLRAFKDDFVLLPMPNWGKKAVTGMGSWAWAIPTQSKNRAGAEAFLKFLGKPQEILAITQANGAIPGRKSMLAQSEEFRPGGRLSVFADQLLAGVAYPRPRTPAYPVITIAFYTAVFDILTKGADVQDALNKAAKRIDANIVANAYFKD